MPMNTDVPVILSEVAARLAHFFIPGDQRTGSSLPTSRVWIAPPQPSPQLSPLHPQCLQSLSPDLLDWTPPCASLLGLAPAHPHCAQCHGLLSPTWMAPSPASSACLAPGTSSLCGVYWAEQLMADISVHLLQGEWGWASEGFAESQKGGDS